MEQLPMPDSCEWDPLRCSSWWWWWWFSDANPYNLRSSSSANSSGRSFLLLADWLTSSSWFPWWWWWWWVSWSWWWWPWEHEWVEAGVCWPLHRSKVKEAERKRIKSKNVLVLQTAIFGSQKLQKRREILEIQGNWQLWVNTCEIDGCWFTQFV